MVRIRHLIRYLLALLLFNLTSCSSMQAVSIENAMEYSPPRGIEYGSLVKVRMLDEREAKFRVTDITPDGLGGKPGFFRFEDMESLKVESTASRVDWGVVLGAIAGIALFVFLIDNADEVRLCSGVPCPGPEP